ncbi:MAG: hypothetical protein E7527_03985 [Ruminococcaceae bacterium]|nr:hypothetical protein [Oscillospiraceae bacterium]
MEGLARWAIAVCTAAVVCSLLQMLFPDTSLGRQARFVLPCVFLCVLLSPIFGGEIDVKLPDFTDENAAVMGHLNDRMRQQTVSQVNGMLLQMLNQSFETQGWEAKKVVTDMDIAEDGSIHMGQITVYVDEVVARRANVVKQVAERRLGMPVTVAVWEEGT